MEKSKLTEIREEIAYFMKRLYDKRLTTSLGGNISFRAGAGMFAITPGQKDKARLTPPDILIIDENGKLMENNVLLKPSIETHLHLSIYNKRPDINAIIHAHPPFVTAFAVTGKKINCRLTGESRAVIGEPVYAPYRLMGTKELAKCVSGSAASGNVIIMKNHGVITLASGLLLAFERIEVAELAARLTVLTDIIGKRKELTDTQVSAIDKLMVF